jgi:uroporphyrin-III C-methyltransferase/precorrin-2 dehydrogenase/sirohydrochlorin ferrochelatase
VAAAALAGIPVTHRGLAAGFVVVSGHAEAAYAPVLDSLAPHALTVVVLMGLGSRAAVAARLLARGWSPLTPAAVVLGAATDEARTWTGTLGALGSVPLADAGPRGREARDGDADPPGTIVVGAVVSLAAVLGRAAETDDSAVAVGEAR